MGGLQVTAYNAAAAVSLSGACLGLAIPLAFCMAASVNTLDIVLWGVAAIVIQLIGFRITDWLLKELPSRIEAGVSWSTKWSITRARTWRCCVLARLHTYYRFQIRGSISAKMGFTSAIRKGVRVRSGPRCSGGASQHGPAFARKFRWLEFR